MRSLRTLFFIVVAIVAPVVAGEHKAESNADVFRRAVANWEAGSVADMDQVVTTDYVGHTSKGDRDRKGLQERIEAFQSTASTG